jgi:alpha-beta hydrolase superfamily lysophospholipase
MSTPRRRAAMLAAAALIAVIVIGRSGRSQSQPSVSVSARDSQPSAPTASSNPQPHETASSEVFATPTTSPSTVASTTVATAPTGPPWSVQQATFEFYDTSRTSPARGASPAHPGRDLHTTVRWPVSQSGQVAPGGLPLIVFAHGYNVSAATYSVMLDDLTRAGIVVAAPDFPGESTALPGPAVESDLVNEPCDMELVATSLERNPPVPLRGALQNAPLIVAGHSDGATAAAAAGYASTCSSVPIRAVVAMSADDVPMTGAFRFGRPPALLAMTGSDDEINPVANTLALYQHVPTPAWLVPIDGGRHLATFTTDADLGRIGALIADFVFMMANGDAAARARLANSAGGRLHLQSR